MPRVGLYDEGGIRDVTAVVEALPALRWPFPLGDQFIAHFDRLRPRIEELGAQAAVIPTDQVRLLSPVANPGKLICAMGNWQHHGAPAGLMGFGFKATSALADPSDPVLIRWPDRATLHEPELAVIIGRECTAIPEAEALDYVAGYTCAFDTTMKEQKETFSFCKSVDRFATYGPCFVTRDAVPDPAQLGYRFWVNGEVRGERRFADLTGSPAFLVAFASTVMTLHPGDILMTGAADVGPVVPGDVMSIEIGGIGRMDVDVALSPHAR
ncbi:fumarylacetoacetate hydrolase family protein [Sphingobium sufflavum]|uniref:fumarylacetoacetate hydrolase family protein n=1 Tax=Sphingobium sufflavum TaxID=1129547 RepID=UPI001F45982A|nr:fumarylacetoacetate hydrolase family protein [Sphingobium sufflavum]MCE7796318.1 fumarylacetoacetate hydrolase family protein [Sphingobium sufflavum]